MRPLVRKSVGSNPTLIIIYLFFRFDVKYLRLGVDNFEISPDVELEREVTECLMADGLESSTGAWPLY